MYIYLNFSDLSEEKQEELRDIARDYVKAEKTQEEAEDLRMTREDLIEERIDKKLLDWNVEGKFIFNI